MEEKEMVELVSQYTDLLNLCESEEEIEKSTALKDFEDKYKDNEELTKLMQTAKDLAVLFHRGEIT